MATAASEAPISQTNGVLAVPVAKTATSTTTSKNSAAKPPSARLKVVVRRLAPTLPESDFIQIIGDEWTAGKGKVDWFSYKLGKESKDPAKPSRPSRAYFHLAHDGHVISLSDCVRNSRFGGVQDAWDSSTQGRPTTEFAPYGRIPGGRRRIDARQGTIDQDPEFMDFLESLANPVSKEPAVDDSADGSGKGDKVTTTPLVQYLKDKKANKAKESAAKQAAKHARQDSQGSQATKAGKDGDGTESKRKGKDGKGERTEKSARDAGKSLKKEAQKANAAKAGQEPKSPRVLTRERGSISAAARILQRDLGLSPANAHRKAKANAEKANAESQEPTEAKDELDKKSAGGGRAKGRGNRGADQDARKPKDPQKENKADTTKPAAPIVLLKKPDSTNPANPPAATASSPASKSSASNTPKKQATVSTPSPGATRAFVKHANPSQGVTDALLREAMEIFGAVSNVEIDKRKGFAYVDFVDHEGLSKAMAANPTKVAQGTVQVLERKEIRPARDASATRGTGSPSRGGRGGGNRRGGRGRGGGNASGAPSSTSEAAK